MGLPRILRIFESRSRLGWTSNGSNKNFDLEQVLDRFNDAARQVLHDHPEEIFQALLGSLRATVQSNDRLSMDNVYDVFDQIIRLVGKPTAESGVLGSLEEPIKKSLMQFAPDAESRLATLAVSFVEQPQYRLAGAEQALELITNRITETISILERRRETVTLEMTAAFNKALKSITAMGNGGLGARRASMFNEMFDAMESYAHDFAIVSC